MTPDQDAGQRTGQSADPAGSAGGVTVYLSMGSNLGDRLYNLREALNYLRLNPQVKLQAVSAIYETDPVGYLEQPPFYNIVVCLQTTLAPLDLLHFCQQTEAVFLRERTIRWGPRTLDIDILYYDDLKQDLPELILPHPRLAERAFVLLPLRELKTGSLQGSDEVRPVLSNWYPITTE
jgi:2-amino-4-hydroxy-6-hydroxymethyldihydropteridine diphosphokinase